jgi:hypothetical protein
VKTLRFLVTVFVAVAGDGPLYLQAALAAPPAPVVLVDSTGKTAARALNDTLTLIRVSPEVAAPAFIRPIYDADGRTASGWATWASGGAVLFTSADCSTGAHIHTLSNAGLRSTSQVETPGGTVLYVGAIGMPMTEDVRSILYASGCSRVTVRQNGLVAVVATINLTTTYPPPLTLQ